MRASAGAMSNASVAARTGENRPRRSCQSAISAPENIFCCDHCAAILASQNAAGCLVDATHDLLRYGLDFSLSQCALPRLNGHRNGQRFLALSHSAALIDVKQLDRFDQLTVDTARGPDHLIGGDFGSNNKGEITRQRHEIGRFKFRPRFVAASFCSGNGVEENLKQRNWTFEVKCGGNAWVEF